MNPSTKKLCNIPIGTIITGKWHHNNYLLSRELGNGANGTVYLARSIFGTVAIKFSESSQVIASEVNVLNSLISNSPIRKKAQLQLGPSLLDVDDLQMNGQIIPFYVMEYIQGVNFLDFIKKQGKSWILPLISELLDHLSTLHQLGYVFGDLKPDNLIVTMDGHLRLIDVGGITKHGRGIKEFTDYFDRGYWNMGDRKADPAYDLFATAMILITTYQTHKHTKKKGGLKQLQDIIKKNSDTNSIRPILLKAIKGNYTSANEMKQSIAPFIKKTPLVLTTKQLRSTQKVTFIKKYRESFFLITLIIALYLFFKLQY